MAVVTLFWVTICSSAIIRPWSGLNLNVVIIQSNLEIRIRISCSFYQISGDINTWFGSTLDNLMVQCLTYHLFNTNEWSAGLPDVNLLSSVCPLDCSGHVTCLNSKSIVLWHYPKRSVSHAWMHKWYIFDIYIILSWYWNFFVATHLGIPEICCLLSPAYSKVKAKGGYTHSVHPSVRNIRLQYFDDLLHDFVGWITKPNLFSLKFDMFRI